MCFKNTIVPSGNIDLPLVDTEEAQLGRGAVQVVQGVRAQAGDIIVKRVNNADAGTQGPDAGQRARAGGD